MKTHLLYILILTGAIVGSAQAQTFGLGGNSRAQTAPKAQQQAASPKQQQNKAASSQAATAPASAQATTQKQTNELPFTKDAVANLSNDNDRKVYDNSLGKVIRFKIVDGEVQFLEDKDRKILIYYDNYKVSKGMDNIVRCTMRLFVLNDLETKISNLGFKLRWPEISTSLQMQQIEPGVTRYTDVMLLGNGCFTMDKTPTVEINRCRVKGLSEEQCADKVKWFSRSKI